MEPLCHRSDKKAPRKTWTTLRQSINHNTPAGGIKTSKHAILIFGCNQGTHEHLTSPHLSSYTVTTPRNNLTTKKIFLPEVITSTSR